MEALISVDPISELESLQDWLARESEFSGRVRLIGQTPVSGQLGSTADVLSVTLGAGGPLSVVAASLRSWFAQPRRSDVRIVVRRADGGSVEIDAKRVGDVDKLLEQTLSRVDRF